MSIPAVILTKIPLAPVKSTSSSSGLEIAASAASCARSGPDADAVPIIAVPIADITVLTSAKSTLIKPERVISSAIPCTAPNNTSLALAKASRSVVPFPKTLSNLLLGIVISESTISDNSLMPCSAAAARFLPSKSKGRVTTATVKIPSSLAILATTGAAPVPVPPPIPAAINTISAPSRLARIVSASSSADLRPTSGFAPAPNPEVICVPS